MIFPQVPGTLRRPYAAVTLAITGLTIVLSLTAADAQSATSAQNTLCAPNEKTWFEASHMDGAGAIAVCSTPDGADEVGAIRVVRLSVDADGSHQPVVVAQAHGAARAQIFTIRRYTRPQTTYLKFEFKNDQVASVIYDTYADGETSTNLKETLTSGATAPQEFELKPHTEALSLMGLESVVKTLPFDE